MSDPVIKSENLNFSYEDNSFTLDNINCAVEKASITVIAGPNGCGKTTFLKLLGNVLKPASGMLQYKGKETGTIKMRDYAKSVAFVRQQNETVPVSVIDYVSLGRLPHSNRFSLFLSKKDKKIVKKSLETCGIEELSPSLLTELSSGQKQLARIARSLTQEPSLLLLDEPTSNLDIKHQITTLDMVVTLVKKLSLTVVMVLHDLNLALQYADKVVLMKEGKIIRKGTPHEVIQKEVLEDVYETPISIVSSDEGNLLVYPQSHLQMR